jgi:hypothetical protein
VSLGFGPNRTPLAMAICRPASEGIDRRETERVRPRRWREAHARVDRRGHSPRGWSLSQRAVRKSRPSPLRAPRLSRPSLPASQSLKNAVFDLARASRRGIWWASLSWQLSGNRCGTLVCIGVPAQALREKQKRPGSGIGPGRSERADGRDLRGTRPRGQLRYLPRRVRKGPDRYHRS